MFGWLKKIVDTAAVNLLLKKKHYYYFITKNSVNKFKRTYMTHVVGEDFS
jgi:hypothetical protein